MQLSSPTTDVKRDKPNSSTLSAQILDHSANERTFLAWMRSASAVLGIGFLIVRLRSFQAIVLQRPGMGWMLGLVFALVGLATVLVATPRYFTVRRCIREDCYEPPKRLVLLFSLAVALLELGVIYFIVITCLPPGILS